LKFYKRSVAALGSTILAGLSVASFAVERPNFLKDFARPDAIVFPEDAPYSPQVVALGKMLFFDPRLSGAQNMSCSTCHNPSFGWETPVALAIGALNQPLGRHAPTIENLAEADAFFWDGRAATLEEQARGPITHPMEMNAQLDDVVARMRRIPTYRQLFRIAFPETGISSETILSAIATFERTVRSGMAPFDDWVGGDETAISPSAQRGFALFAGKADCVACHSGWAFTDHRFYNVGIDGDDPGREAVEPGEGRRFKTPGLRNISLRAPFMHDGSISTLRDVIEHYRIGGNPDAQGRSDIEPLELTPSEANDLHDFLLTLTAHDPHVSTPALPVE